MHNLLAFLLLLLLAGCQATSPPVRTIADQAGDVIGVRAPMLTPDFWLARTKGHPVLQSPDAIHQFNQQAFATQTDMVDVTARQPSLNRTALHGKITALSTPSASNRFYADGRRLTTTDYRRYHDSLALDTLADMTRPRYALVVRRTVMRTFPTRDRVFKADMDRDLDRFQETGLFPAQALVLWHLSRDRQWVFAQSYNYAAWVPVADIAISDRATIHAYQAANDFLVITGDRVTTTYVPDHPDISDQPLEMGVRLPLVPANKIGNALYGQNPYASHAVQLPTRDDDGQLVLKPALIAKSRDVSIGYLPLTRANLVRQSFKFLGERYGWGHDYNARDCTGFVGEIYKSFGLLLPRNSGQQGHSNLGANRRFVRTTPLSDKHQALADLDVGDLLYIPGHVMMYLGDVDGAPYVIHDAKGLGYVDARGQYYRGTLNGVSVTPLLPLHLSPETSFLDRLYNIKRVR